MRRFMLIVIPIIFAACAACEIKVVPPPQKEGTVHLEGDSVTFNTYYDGGVPDFHTSGDFTPGSTADLSWSGEAADTRLPRAVAEGKVETLVWALGLNEIFVDPNKQWSGHYQWLWFDLLKYQTPASTCIVMVKPWVLPKDYPNRPLQALNAERGWIDAFAKTRPNTVVVDWKPILEANPHFSATDGVHIDRGTGGAEARDAMYREGLARCGS